jgi:hypothetical protein
MLPGCLVVLLHAACACGVLLLLSSFQQQQWRCAGWHVTT